MLAVILMQAAGDWPAGFWLLLPPLILGFAGLYLLLPRVRGYRALWGTLLAGLALVAAGWLLVEQGLALVETILFYAFSAIALVSGGLMITQRNPVRAALSFALVVLSTCGLFLLQAAPFLMAATIIIYAGAIIVTFLFVIMLAQQSGWSDADCRSREPFLSTVAGFVLLGALLAVLRLTYDTQGLDSLLDRTGKARQESSLQAIRADLGGEDNFFRAWERETKKSRVALASAPPVANAIANAEISLRMGEPDLEQVKQSLDRLYDEGVKLRQIYGSLQPPPEVVLSGYSRSRDRQGNPALPKENVAFLGRSLFTDFLLPVELGGTLLLVAVVGAIAIVSRRTEELR